MLTIEFKTGFQRIGEVELRQAKRAKATLVGFKLKLEFRDGGSAETLFDGLDRLGTFNLLRFSSLRQ